MAFIELKPEDKEKLERWKAKLKTMFSGNKNKSSTLNQARFSATPQISILGTSNNFASRINYFLLSPHPSQEIFYYRIAIASVLFLIGLILVILSFIAF